MFLESVINGLSVLTYWQTYVAGLIYCLIILLPLLLIGLGMSKFEGLGCLTIVIDPFFRSLATVIFVFTLFPIIFGISKKAAWSFPWMVLINEPWYMIKVAGILIIFSFFLALIPIVGQFQSVNALGMGSICLILILKIIHEIDPGFPINRLVLFPGLFYIIGFLFISAITSYLGIIITTLIMSFNRTLEGFSELINIPVGAVFGFIPVFIYGAWIGIQIRLFS